MLSNICFIIFQQQIDYEMYELGSMARALDIQKSLAVDAHFIHAEVTRRKEHDPEVKIID